MCSSDLRGVKQAGEAARHARAQVREGNALGRDAARQAYSSSVRSFRAWDKAWQRAWSSVSTETSVRRELRAAARGDAPIVVGPWLGEVGYEALYWVPFVRWFASYYRVPRERLVVVSRGGVSSWYADISDRYIELLDLFTPQEFAARNVERQASGDQKQLGVAGFDRDILERLQAQVGGRLHLCHPSAMFRLMRRFWLGNESLQLVLDHTRHVMQTESRVELPGLPERYVAVKFYTARSLPDTRSTRESLRALIRHVAADLPVVMLTTRLALDEHDDYLFEGLTNVQTLDPWMTPQNNLGVQSEVIRRAQTFVGTCGSLAWLAPMLGTETLAIYADEHLLTPHLYAASQIYPSIGAAPFTPLHIRAVQALAPEAAGR
mgnify:CR=1 FL=1